MNIRACACTCIKECMQRNYRVIRHIFVNKYGVNKTTNDKKDTQNKQAVHFCRFFHTSNCCQTTALTERYSAHQHLIDTITGRHVHVMCTCTCMYMYSQTLTSVG